MLDKLIVEHINGKSVIADILFNKGTINAYDKGILDYYIQRRKWIVVKNKLKSLGVGLYYNERELGYDLVYVPGIPPDTTSSPPIESSNGCKSIW